MRAAILAAGEGSRLRGHFDSPKPLIPLLGVPLILRNILSLQEAGIEEFVIVTGCYENELRNYLGDGSRWGVSITYVHNSRWKLGNGVSTQTIQQVYRPGEKFLLLMADHLFEPEVFRDFILKGKYLDEGEVLLAADQRLDQVHDIAESTKIRSDGNVATQLGKSLSDYNAVDCGMFLCTGVIFEALSEAINKGRYGLTDGVNILAKKGRVKLHFVNESWVDVDDVESFRYGESMILKSVVKENDGFISKHFNRKISLQISRRLVFTKVTPNQISVFSFILGLFSAFSFGTGHPILGGIIAQMMSILDGVDGEIARIKFKKSAYGGLFDSIFDRYADYFIIASIGYWWFLHSEQSVVAFLVTMLALSGQPLSMLIKEKYKSITGKDFIPEQHDGMFRFIPANRDGRLFLIMLGGIFNALPAILIILAIITHLQTFIRLFSLKKKM